MKSTLRTRSSHVVVAVRIGLLLGLSIAALGCSRREKSPQATATASITAATPTPVALESSPTLLLDTGGSAYASTLGVDGEASYLLSKNAAFRLVPGRAPQRWGADFGYAPALGVNDILFYADGALRRMPKRGGEATVVVALPRPPQRITVFGEHLVWVDRTEDGRVTIQTMDGSSVGTLYAPSENLAALVMEGEAVYFVEQAGSDGWRLGSISLLGGSPRFTEVKTSRTPSMLAAAGDIFYYDGPSRTVRRVSLDLEREDVVARDVICSPIAVAEDIFCAQPGGLRVIGFDGTVRRTIPLRRHGSLTAMAANATWLTWLLDAGAERLVVETIPLTAAGIE